MLLSVDGQLGYFHLLVTVNGATVNMHLHVFVWVPVFNSFDMYVRVELLSHGVIIALWGTAKLFSTAVVAFYIPTSNVRTPSRFAHDTHLRRSGYFIKDETETQGSKIICSSQFVKCQNLIPRLWSEVPLLSITLVSGLSLPPSEENHRATTDQVVQMLIKNYENNPV